MAILLSEFEHAPRHKGDYDAQLVALRKRLAHAQLAHIVHRRRAMIVFEGLDAGGEGGTIQRLIAGWDARHYAVFAILAATPAERARHHLARFWAKLPADGRIHVFDRSWYGRVLSERVAGLTTKPQSRKAYDEINEFEAQQADSGTTLVKLFLHIGLDEQDRRLRNRLEHPWKRWTIAPDDLRNHDRRADYVAAAEEMLARTDTRWAPWTVIDAGHDKYARLTVLTRVAEALEKAVPVEPPAADEAIAAWARGRWGLELG